MWCLSVRVLVIVTITSLEFFPSGLLVDYKLSTKWGLQAYLVLFKIKIRKTFGVVKLMS